MLNERLQERLVKEGSHLRSQGDNKCYAYYKAALALGDLPDLTEEDIRTQNYEAKYIGPSMKSKLIQFLDEMEAKALKQNKMNLSNPHKHYTERDKVLELIEPLITYLNMNKIRYEFGGSFRRECQYVGDIDILIFEEKLPTFDGVDCEVLARGDKLCKFKFENLEVDIRLFKEENRGAALLFYTGPKEYNIYLRVKAKQLGMKLNEYCLENVNTGEQFYDSESQILSKLGLKYTTPRERELWR